jgi:hypothetical protein
MVDAGDYTLWVFLNHAVIAGWPRGLHVYDQPHPEVRQRRMRRMRLDAGVSQLGQQSAWALRIGTDRSATVVCWRTYAG